MGALVGLTVLHRAPPAQPAAVQPRVRVYFPAQRRTVAMPLEGYVLGVVAAEMPERFHDEALQAQMVVARTYAVRRPGGGCAMAPGADVCASPETGQAYVSEADYRAQHGRAAASALWRRLQAASAATRGLIITYQAQPIDALYHSDSIGATAAARDYFGADVPYLQAVREPYGGAAPRAHSTQAVKLAQVAAVFGQSPLALQRGVSVLSHTGTGRAATVRVGDAVVPARVFREKLGLNSTDFTADLRGNTLLVSTRGYGHGVGMSQYGADEMAAQGADFRAIIHHYYTGVQITPLA